VGPSTSITPSRSVPPAPHVAHRRWKARMARRVGALHTPSTTSAGDGPPSAGAKWLSASCTARTSAGRLGQRGAGASPTAADRETSSTPAPSGAARSQAQVKSLRST
jgi:hypothetical protein